MLHSMEMQPNHTYVDVFDANNEKYAEQFDEVGCCRLFAFPNGAASNMPYSFVWSKIEELMEAGYVQKADTLEELAEKLNIPADNFVATVNRYNELCAKGVETACVLTQICRSSVRTEQRSRGCTRRAMRPAVCSLQHIRIFSQAWRAEGR